MKYQLCINYRFFVKNALATKYDIRISAAAHTTPVVASVHTTKPLIQKKLKQSYSKIVNYLVKKFASDKAIAEIDSRFQDLGLHQTGTHDSCEVRQWSLRKILRRHGLLWQIHPYQHFHSDCPSFNVSQLSGMLNASISRRGRDCLEKTVAVCNPTRSDRTGQYRQSSCIQPTVRKASLWEAIGARNQIGLSTSPARLSRFQLRSPPVVAIQTPTAPDTRLDSHSSSSSLTLPVNSAKKVCYNPSHSTQSPLYYHVMRHQYWPPYMTQIENESRQNRHQRPTQPDPRFGEDRRIPNHRPQRSLSKQNTRVLKSAKNAPPLVKN